MLMLVLEHCPRMCVCFVYFICSLRKDIPTVFVFRFLRFRT
jgi:hypothetical protein